MGGHDSNPSVGPGYFSSTHRQGCEPKTETRFFQSFFFCLRATENRLFKVGFRLPQKNESEKPTRFFRSFFFPVRYVKNSYIISVWKPRHEWTHMDSFGKQQQQQQHSSIATTKQQQRQQQQCAARFRRTIMSSSDDSASFEPEAEAGAGNRVMEVDSSDVALKAVSKPLGGRVAASKAAAVFVTCKQSSHGWLRSVDKERAQCPSCAMSVPWC